MNMGERVDLRVRAWDRVWGLVADRVRTRVRVRVRWRGENRVADRVDPVRSILEVALREEAKKLLIQKEEK